MEQIIQKNVERIKQKFEQVLRSEAMKYIMAHTEDVKAEQFIEETGNHLHKLFAGELKGNILNGMSKSKRKEFLIAQGIQVESSNSKKVNMLVKEILLQNVDFDYKQWIAEYFVQNPQKWTEYKKEALAVKEQEWIIEKMEKAALNVLTANNLHFYLLLRSRIAQELVSDLMNTQYKLDDEEEELLECGPFEAAVYFKVEDFLSEYTGEEREDVPFYKYMKEFETYQDRYRSLVNAYVYKEVPVMILEFLLNESKYFMYTEESISELLEYELADLDNDYLYRVMNELMEDMLQLAEIPFDVEIHREIYVQQLAEKKKKIKEQKRKEKQRLERERAEQRERERKEEEMILQIIGREYETNLSPYTKYILHIGETNTGKTHTALTEMRKAASGLYLGPLRLLALEVYETLSESGIHCGLKTGEEEKNLDGATHISATVEMFSEKERYECVVIDEAQMIADKDRGFAWYKAITSVQADKVHIIGSRNVKSMLLQLLDGNDIEVIEYKRNIPLTVQQKNFKISKVTKGDALIVFSRKKVLQVAAKLESDGHKVSVVYGGMPPETRQKQIEQFHKGETEVVVSTDAIGMGLNLPIRRVIFLENEKFDGTRRRLLTSQEIKQIAGRAGRKGKYDEGFVAFSYDVKKMKNLLEKNDKEIQTFAISPTQNIFNRFRNYRKDLNEFFRLWEKYDNPYGTVKAPLTEEKDLYEEIRGTEIEAKLSIADLYSFLHLPFSSYETSLKEQWKENMFAIVNNQELQEPIIHRGSLEELELSYKAIGLHLLFLYRLEKRTEAFIWERMRDEISEEIHRLLKKDIKKYTKKCNVCGKALKWDYSYNMCQNCHNKRYGKYYYRDEW
ncbi:MAG: DEAD/DEAH box helicase [Bacillus sp. (in: firmicutes)]